MSARLKIDLPRSLAAIVEERIRDAIVNAELKFGEALTDEIIVGMGVSRTPLREALTRLETQGLVVVQPKRGTFVFCPSVEDVEQLARFRMTLERSGATLSLAQDRDEVVRDLSAAVAEMSDAMDRGDGKAYCRADTRFHQGFFSHCGNQYVRSAYTAVSWQIAALRAHLTVFRRSERGTSIEEHRQMLRCFEEGRRLDLQHLLRRHILRSASVYAQEIRNRSCAGAGLPTA